MSLDDGQISSLDVPEVAKSIKELTHANVVSGGIIQNTDGRSTDHRHGRLLRARRQRPGCHRAADERDEFAASHSMTSSARTSSDGGMVSPSAFAVLLLMTNSNRVASRSGNSLGAVPPRIFATCSAALV
jgi:hypothetical protein